LTTQNGNLLAPVAPVRRRGEGCPAGGDAPNGIASGSEGTAAGREGDDDPIGAGSSAIAGLSASAAPADCLAVDSKLPNPAAESIGCFHRVIRWSVRPPARSNAKTAS